MDVKDKLREAITRYREAVRTQREANSALSAAASAFRQAEAELERVLRATGQDCVVLEPWQYRLIPRGDSPNGLADLEVTEWNGLHLGDDGASKNRRTERG